MHAPAHIHGPLNCLAICQVIATCKHWLGYSLEGALGVSRYAHDIHISPQDLVDTDLPPFEACIQVSLLPFACLSLGLWAYSVRK
jgi:beta-glucosidase-like glycosyl hydrolase